MLVLFWHMTSVSFKSWVSYWVADVHLKSLCLESTASGRWHTWGSTWRWRWRLTHPTRPQLRPAKNGGKRRLSFTFLCAEKKSTRMNHFDTFWLPLHVNCTYMSILMLSQTTVGAAWGAQSRTEAATGGSHRFSSPPTATGAQQGDWKQEASRLFFFLLPATSL